MIQGRWVVLGCVLALTNAGCGRNGGVVIKSADVSAYTQLGQTYTQVAFGLNTGSLDLPSVVFPVMNPQAPGEELGKISLLKMVGGGSKLAIDLNLTRAAQIQGTDESFLPNGSPLPLSLPAGTAVFGFPVAHTGIKAYFALGPHTAVMGAALPIREFLPLGQKFGILNIFPSFHVGAVSGIAGLFLSPVPEQNGLAVFADLSGALSVEAMRGVEQDWSPPGKNDPRVEFKEPLPSKDIQKKVAHDLDEVGKTSGVLHFE